MDANSITDVDVAAREITLAAGAPEAEVRGAPKALVMPHVDRRQLSALARTP
jgi:hypothetical protein